MLNEDIACVYEEMAQSSLDVEKRNCGFLDTLTKVAFLVFYRMLSVHIDYLGDVVK